MTWAITGTGMVSSLGGDAASSFEAYCAGATSLHPLRAFDRSKYRVGSAYELDDRPAGAPDAPGRAGRWLAGAVSEALAQAGLADAARRGDLRVPVVVGTGLAEQRSLELWWTAGAPVTLDDLHFARVIERATGLPHTLTIVNACAAGLFALAVATDLLALGEADAVVVAGTDAISESMFGLLDRVNMRPPEQVRPFDADRLGVILGEGAGAIVVEPTSGARERGAASLAALRGVGTTCDAHHVTAPLRAGVTRAFRDALQRAGRDPADIDVVLAHGTGTFLNDQTEAQVLGDVFGDAPRRPLVTALKSLIGHTSGASGLMSLVTAVTALEEGRVPPTRHHVTPIEEIRDFHVVTGEAHRAPLRTAQVNAFGFGGVNAVTVVERPGGDAAAAPAASGRDVAVTGVGTEIPGAGSLRDLLALAAAGEPLAAGAFDPAATLGRRGLRYKDRATLLALCAVRRAIDASGLSEGELAASCGVVVSTDLAIVDTVCRVVDTLHDGGVPAASPMDLPNVSGNVAASQVAIWFGLTGLNLTLSSGPTSGVDAIYHAAAAIRAGRADRMVVVGVEPSGEAVDRLLRDTALRHGDDPERVRAFDGAVALVLEASDLAAARGAPALAQVGPYTRHTKLGEVGAPGAGLWAAPCRVHADATAEVGALAREWGVAPERLLDVSATTGEASAAAGVLQCAAAVDRMAAGAAGTAHVSAGGCWGGGYATIVLRAGP